MIYSRIPGNWWDMEFRNNSDGALLYSTICFFAKIMWLARPPNKNDDKDVSSNHHVRFQGYMYLFYKKTTDLLPVSTGSKSGLPQVAWIRAGGCFRPHWSSWMRLWKLPHVLQGGPQTVEPRKKKPLTIHYTGWLIGILTMVYHNPYIPG